MLSTFRHMTVPRRKSLECHEEEKSRLIGGLKIAIKEVQDHESSNNFVSLTERHIQAQKLCISLDKIFLHGLRIITSGYWTFVKFFLHGDTLNQIASMKNVKSAIGKGRVWLYLALNENSLESYICSFINNKDLIDKHYISQAFINDAQNLELFQMLISGLEYVTFKLNPDLRFLDTSSALMHINSPDSEAESVGSSRDWSISSNQESYRTDRSDSSSSVSLNEIESRPSDDSIQNVDDDVTSLEVVHQAAKIKRKKRHSKKDSKYSQDALNCTTNNKTESNIDKNSIQGPPKLFKELDFNFLAEKSAYCADSDGTVETVQTAVVEFNHQWPEISSELNWKFNAADISINKAQIPVSERGTPEGQEDPPSVRSPTIPQNKEIKCNETLECSKLDDAEVALEVAQEVVNSDCDSIRSKNDSEDQSSNISPAAESHEASLYDLYSSGSESLNINLSKTDDSIDLKKSVDLNETVPVNPPVELIDCPIQQEIDLGLQNMRSSCVSLDNNSVLYMSLEILKFDDEECIKMYGTATWKTEKLFVLITNKLLYLLYRGLDERLYEVKNEIHFAQIDYIVVSLNYQSFTIICFDRRNKFTVDVGDELTTRSILSNLEVVMRKSPRKHNLPSVYTDAKSQIISLQKCFSEELRCELQDVSIRHYVHVHWEDSLGNLGVKNFVKSGHLHVQKIVVSLLGNKMTWVPIFITLRNEELVAYKKESSDTPEWKLKLSNVKDVIIEENRLELMIDNKHKVKLLAPSAEECKQWHHILHLSKSKRMTMDDLKSVCIPSSLVVSNNALFMCDEETDTGHFVISGKSLVTDLSYIGVDSLCPYYCILVFESGDSSSSLCGDWILYFSSKEEVTKLIEILEVLWEVLFEVKISRNQISEDYLLQKCRDTYDSLKF